MKLNSFRLLFFSGLLSLNIIALNAQTVRGIITLRDGQTITGDIAYDGWAYQQSFVSIVTGSGGYPQRIPIDIIRMVNMGPDKIYRSYKIQYDTSQLRPDRLSLFPEARWKTEDMLLWQVHEGAARLYVVVDRTNRTHYFVQKGDSIPEALLYKKYYTDANEQEIKRNKRFRRQLVGAFLDCPNAREAALNANYTEKDLLKVMKAYDQCKGIKPQNNGNVEKPQNWIYGVLAGGSLSQPFDKVKKITNLNSTIQYNPDYAAGIWAERYFKKMGYRSSIYLDAFYNAFNSELSNLKANPISTVFRSQTDRGSMLRMHTIFRVGARKGATSRLYAGVGLSYSFLLGKGSRKTVQEERLPTSNGTTLIVNDTRIKPLAPINLELAGIVNIGFSYKRLGLELRYDNMLGGLIFETQKNIDPLRLSTVHVLASYRFGQF
jgi:hypothetical protein